MVIGRLSCGRFAPGSGRVVVVGPCGLGFRPEKGPWSLSPGTEGSSPVLQPKVLCFLSKSPGVDQQQKAPPVNQWQAPRPLSVPPGAAKPNDSPRQSPSHARGPKPPRRARRARG